MSERIRWRGVTNVAPLALLAVGSLTACVGSIGTNDDGDDGVGAGPPQGTNAYVADHSRFPRLSHSQWENTVVDLFELSAPTGLSLSFAPDTLGGKAFDNNEAGLNVTPNHWADYQRASEEVAAIVIADPSLLAKIAPASLPTEPKARAAAFVTDFGARAFRRPLEAAEVSQFAALFDLVPEVDPDAADPFAAGVALVIEAMLQSPHFLYRVESSDKSIFIQEDNIGIVIPLGNYEVASRLSYAIWNTMPDRELFEAAAAGELEDVDSVEANVRRMLEDPRANFVISAYHDQLYQVDQYTNLSKTAYPEWDPAIEGDMQKELSLFVASVLEKGGGLNELLTSRTGFVNARLAALYGLDTSGLDDENFKEVELPAGERSGILTRAGFLAWHGDNARPDTILRGAWINRRILCKDPGDPPDAAVGAVLPEGPATNREKVTALTGLGTCGEGCHSTVLNPVGFAFERYGGIGEYRTMAEGAPVDSSATYPFNEGDKSFADAIEFSQLVADGEQSHRCYAEFWLQFTHGRDAATQDEWLVDEAAVLSRGGASMKDVIVALVTSEPFLTRPLSNVEAQ